MTKTVIKVKVKLKLRGAVNSRLATGCVGTSRSTLCPCVQQCLWFKLFDI